MVQLKFQLTNTRSQLIKVKLKDKEKQNAINNLQGENENQAQLIKQLQEQLANEHKMASNDNTITKAAHAKEFFEQTSTHGLANIARTNSKAGKVGYALMYVAQC